MAFRPKWDALWNCLWLADNNVWYKTQEHVGAIWRNWIVRAAHCGSVKSGSPYIVETVTLSISYTSFKFHLDMFNRQFRGAPAKSTTKSTTRATAAATATITAYPFNIWSRMCCDFCQNKCNYGLEQYVVSKSRIQNNWLPPSATV